MQTSRWWERRGVRRLGGPPYVPPVTDPIDPEPPDPGQLYVPDERAPYRVVVTTNIGGDDGAAVQSLVRLLVFSDQLSVEGIIVTPGAGALGQLAAAQAVLDHYETDRPNLATRSATYPTTSYLRSRTVAGNLAVFDAATSAPSEGSELLATIARTADQRPVYVLAWGSLTAVAQACKDHPTIAPKLRVLAVGGATGDAAAGGDPAARAYLAATVPELWMVEMGSTVRGMDLGGDVSLGTNATFVATHVNNHGALGAHYASVRAELKETGSPTLLYLLAPTVGLPGNPEGPHWGGRFVRPDSLRENYWGVNPDPLLAQTDGAGVSYAGAKSVNQYRQQWNDAFRLRMDRALAPVVVPPGQEIANAGLSSETVYVNTEPSKAELPREWIDTKYTLPSGTGVITYAPPDRAALRSWLTNTWAPATSRYVVRLANGVDYGNLFIPKKSNPNGNWTYFVPTDMSMLPPPGTRIHESIAAQLPKINLNRNGNASAEAALSFAAGANYVRFVGISVGLTAIDIDGNGGTLKGTKAYYCTALVRAFPDTLNGVEDLPHHLTFDRVVVRGATKSMINKGISIKAAYWAVVDSWISEIHYGSDSNAITSTAGYVCKIVNNHLDSAGENILFGGSPPSGSLPDDQELALQPRDAEIRRNYFYTPLKYKYATPAFFAAAYLVKSAFTVTSSTTTSITVTGQSFGDYSMRGYFLRVTAPNGTTRYLDISATSTAGTATINHATTSTPVVPGVDQVEVIRGYEWIVKNSGESKNLVRCLWEGNVFENSWIDGQKGYGLVLKTDNNLGTFDFTSTNHHTVRHNWTRNVCLGMTFAGDAVSTAPGIPSHHLHAYNNLITDVCSGINTASDGACLQFSSRLSESWVEDMTVVISESATGSTATAKEGGKSGSTGNPIIAWRDGYVKNCILSRGLGSKRGVYGSGTTEGLETITASYPGVAWTDVSLVMKTNQTLPPYPSGVTKISTRADVGFRSPTDGTLDPMDYSIPAGPYAGRGCNVPKLMLFIAGVRD